MDMRGTEFAASEVKARFSELLGRVEAGEEITINRHGVPVAKLVQVKRTLSADERRERLVAFQEWRRSRGPTLGSDLTLTELIAEGRGAS